MHLQQGTLLQGGKYRIERVLGQGSFGITYLAIHTSLERKVAIKEFFMKELNTRGEDGSVAGMTDGSLSFNYGQKFKKEAINLSRLNHPNIVRAIDSFEENGTYYYVMDYVDGENLNDYLKHNKISQQEAVRIITEVANALLYMHETHHMLHLDLKPGNIMRRASDGHIFLIDFGLSKHYGSDGEPETTTSIGLGTPGYAPPEQGNQTRTGETCPSIDVYALGATLYKLLTGETPPHSSEIISDDELVENRLRANGITGDIVGVVVNAMLSNIHNRIQNVTAFIEVLSLGCSQTNISKSFATPNKEAIKVVVEDEETVLDVKTVQKPPQKGGVISWWWFVTILIVIAGIVWYNTTRQNEQIVYPGEMPESNTAALSDDETCSYQDQIVEAPVHNPVINEPKLSEREKENIIKTELARYILQKSSKVSLSSKAKAGLIESTWPEIYCDVEGCLGCPTADIWVDKVGINRYRYSCICSCGCETYEDNWIICAECDDDGNVTITDFDIVD